MRLRHDEEAGTFEVVEVDEGRPFEVGETITRRQAERVLADYIERQRLEAKYGSRWAGALKKTANALARDHGLVA
jgi:hypothetical protein